MPPVVCGMVQVLFVRHYLQLFVGGLMYCCSSLPTVVCRRVDVLFVRLYLQYLVGGLVYCLFVFTSSCL
jgi:hypothetical protein